MSREVSVRTQLLSIMDSLVVSIVAEICQLDIFQSKSPNGSTEADIKTNLTAVIRKITTSTAEHICRILHKASSGPRIDLTRQDKAPHGESSGIKRQEITKGDRLESASGTQERVNEDLQTVERLRLEEAFERQPGGDESEASRPNFKDESYEVSIQLNTNDGRKTCRTCRKTFSHQNLHECKERVHECSLCEKRFRFPNHLRDHMTTSHGSEGPFICSACGKSFTSMVVLRAHEQTHSGEKNFACSECGSRFLTKSNLDYHRRVHTGEKPYACQHCGKSFAQKGNLKTHERLHTGERPFRCEDCGQSFTHANTFKSHRQLHTGIKAFCCELCGKGFRRGTHLKTHLLTHSGDKPFRCDVCEKTFALKGSLKTHRLTHTGQKNYACDICGKRFTQASSLAKHRQLHAAETLLDYQLKTAGSLEES